MFTIGYGVGNTQSRDEGNYNSIAQVLNDSSLQAQLSYDPSQVDARVNGVIIDVNAPVTTGMRIELVKKAGRKSAETSGACGTPALTHDNQLSPIGLASETRGILVAKAEEAKAPFYAALNKAESANAKALKAKQREVVADTDAFKKYEAAIIDRLVEANFVDSVGSLTIPNDVRSELAKLADESDKELEAERKQVRDAEKKANAWLKSVIADVSMSVTIADQRVLVAKALASNPLEAWTFEA
jgi:hypothetical protein